jgi:hypothetical protein
MTGIALAACIEMCLAMGCKGTDLAHCILKMLGN